MGADVFQWSSVKIELSGTAFIGEVFHFGEKSKYVRVVED